MSETHDLLPWYVNGTLDDGERRSFQEHLASCAKCTAELPVLEEIRKEMAQPDWGEHAEHPAAEALSLMVVEGIEDPEMRRHLALCVSCSEEARWLRGEETAGVSDEAPIGRDTAIRVPQRRPSKWTVPLALAAAALVVLLAAGALLRSRPAGSLTGVGPPIFVPSVERDLGRRHEVIVPAGVGVLTLHFQADLRPEGFPAVFEVTDASGRTILKKADLRELDLLRGTFIFYCGRSECRDGDYVARLTPAGGNQPPIAYPFRLISAP